MGDFWRIFEKIFLTGHGNRYGFTREDLEELLQSRGKDRSKLSLSASALELEIGARLTEAMLGNEQFIERIVRSDASLAERIIERIKRLATAFSTLTNKEARAQYNRLKKAEKLYMKAVENAGYYECSR